MRDPLRSNVIVRRAAVLFERLLVATPPLSLLLIAAQAQAQPVTIPLAYHLGSNWGLSINIAINSTSPQPFFFDTGSASFNAFSNPNNWGSISLSSDRSHTCYVGFCDVGNKAQVPTLNFYAPGVTGGTPTATLTTVPAGSTMAPAGVGFHMLVITETTTEKKDHTPDKPINTFPADLPPKDGLYGTFGAGNFTSGGPGGVLGQAYIPGAYHQGYVVSANGQPNPALYGVPSGPPSSNIVNLPSGTSTVTVGGVSQQVNPACVACVTVGLTPALIGQFGPVNNVVPVKAGGNFANPYGTGSPNQGSTEFGAQFNVALQGRDGSTVSHTNQTLLDSGTGYYWLSGSLDKGSTAEGATISMSGVSSAGGATVPTNQANLTSGTFGVTFKGKSDDPDTIGIPFFMQNSVMYDLTGGVIGYTPFYVSAADLATTANGPLIVTSGNVPLGLAGIISGPGGVTIQAGGAAQLSAFNTYTGATTTAAASGGSPAGLLLVSGPGSIASSSGVVNNGIFDISGAWAPVSIQTLSGSGVTSLGPQNLTITNGGSFSGTIADGGTYGGVGGSLTITGGSMTLSGANTYTGTTSVVGGTLAVNGSLASGTMVGSAGTLVVNGVLSNNVINGGTTVVNGTVGGTVLNAGILGGSGTVTGSVASSGVMAPGNGIGIGTLSIGGNHVQLSGSVYVAEVAGTGQGDRITVGGTASIQGASVQVFAQPGTTFAPRTTWRILNAAGGLSGTYASVNELYPFLFSSLSYDANNAWLTLEVGGFAAAATTRTQAAVGSVIDANVNTATGDFAQVLSAMATGVQSNAAAQAVLQSLSGNNYAGFSSSMVQGAALFMNNFASQAGGGGSPASNRVALAEACDVACDGAPPALWGAWGGALGGLGTIGANAAVGGVTYNAGGFAAGLDRLAAPNLRVGVTAGFTTGSQWVSGFSGKGMTDTFLAGLYGGYNDGRVYADVLLGYAYSANQMWRTIAIPGLQPRTAQGYTGANQWYGQVETGYRFDIGTAADATLTPFVRLQGYTGTQNGFSETGAQSLDLTVATQTTSSLRSVLGAQLGGAMDLGWREKLALQFRLGWSHEYASTARPVTATLAGAPLMPFTTYGIAPQRDGVVLGLSANTAIAEATSIYLRYEGNISGQDSAHALTAGVRMTW